MYGVEEDTKYNSAEELIKMGRQLDILQSSEETVTTDVNNEEWDCQPQEKHHRSKAETTEG